LPHVRSRCSFRHQLEPQGSDGSGKWRAKEHRLRGDSQQSLVESSSISPPSRDRIFFPGLNLVRAYAALSVVAWHQKQFQILYHIPIADRFLETLSRIFLRGDDAVMLFFVLSGFLITYLLLAEHRRTGTIAVRKFYVRRILRIWPLYYLLVVLGFLVLPLCVGWKHYPFNYHESSFIPRLICYLLLIPNVAYTLWPGATAFGAIPIAHLWSIGVEEQFYLLWPALLKGLMRWILWLIFAVIAIKAALYWCEAYYQHATHNWRRGAYPEKLRHFFEFLSLLRLDCMAIGGLAAYIAFHVRGVARRIIYHPATALLVLAGFGYVVISEFRPAGLSGPYVGMLVVALYAAVILCAAGNPGLSPKWIPWPLDFLGRISYGIYMYHVPVLFCLVVTLQKNHATWHTGMTIKKINHRLKYFAPAVASGWRNVALFSLVVAITIAVATISFYGFETPFLRLKRRYTVVPSGSPDVAHV